MKEILAKCKCGVYFTANQHKDYYEKAEDWLIKQFNSQQEIDEIPKDVWRKMVDKDTIYCLQFYPNTPIGFYRIFHFDYDMLMDEAREILQI